MPKGPPMFIVEGHLEHKFIEKQCGKKFLIRCFQNGKDVSAVNLGKQVRVIVASAPKEPEFVVILADRERRTESSIAFEKAVTAEVASLNIPISVHVPDVMIENWILADPEACAGEGLEIATTASHEGIHGKGVIDKASKQSFGTAYNEIADGVRLLSKCSPSVMSTRSASFLRFFSAMATLPMQCHWLDK